MVKNMNNFLRLNKMLMLFLVFQFSIKSIDENDYKLKEECEQLILYYESYQQAYVANPNNSFIKEVLLSLITKLEEKRDNLKSKNYIQARVDFKKLEKIKWDLLLPERMVKATAAGIIGLISYSLFKNKDNIYYYLNKNSDLILKSSLSAIAPAAIVSYALYKVISKSGKYFTDSIVSSNERLKLDQKNKQDENSSSLADEKNSKARLFKPYEIQEKFSSVAGVVEAKEELEEIVDYLRKPEKYKKIGAKIPKGILLVGEPGNGKTMLARAVAGEANCHFFSVSGSEFVEQWVGLGAARVRDLFNQARKYAPCIIFIDEIDAIGTKRSSNGESGGEREYSQTLNQLLVGMDGFEKSSTPIIIMGATNKPEVLDKALLRPGRFDRQVYVPYPDLFSREQILKIHSSKIKTDQQIDFKKLAIGCPGFSGAELANFVNEAALIAIKNNNSKVTMQDFDMARDKVILGKELKTINVSQETRKITAYHESGHALVYLLVPECADSLFKVTITPRGRALGVTHAFPNIEKHDYSKDELLAKIEAALGGRIAEELIFGKQYVGACNDFEKATSIARKMVTEYGMSDIGPINCKNEKHSKIEQETDKLIMLCYHKVHKLLTKNIDKLHKLANALLDKETMFAAEICTLLDLELKK